MKSQRDRQTKDYLEKKSYPKAALIGLAIGIGIALLITLWMAKHP